LPEGRVSHLLPPLIAAFEAGATIGEITRVTRMAYNCPYDPHGMIESLI